MFVASNSRFEEAADKISLVYRIFWFERWKPKGRTENILLERRSKSRNSRIKQLVGEENRRISGINQVKNDVEKRPFNKFFLSPYFDCCFYSMNRWNQLRIYLILAWLLEGHPLGEKKEEKMVWLLSHEILRLEKEIFWDNLWGDQSIF